MTRIEQHISDLLFIHDCIIIPGFGAFVANHIPAEIKSDTGIFSPPSKEIGFNRTLKHNDGTLINHLILKENITYPSANEVLDLFVSNLNKDLTSTSRYTFGEIGIFSKDKNGVILFEPNKNQNFLADAYGLGSFHFTPLLETLHSVKREIQTPRHASLLRYSRQIAAGLLLAAGLFMFSPETKMGLISTENQASLIPHLSNVQAPIKHTTAQTERNAIVVITSSGTQAKIDKQIPEPSYFLIAASFNSILPAEKLVLKLKKRGFSEARIIRTNNSNRYRVSLFSFSNKAAAYQVLDDYRKKKEYSTVWLHKIKS